jgi:hypothetical protein
MMAALHKHAHHGGHIDDHIDACEHGDADVAAGRAVLTQHRVSTIDLTVLFSWNGEFMVHKEEPVAEAAEQSKAR